MIDKPEEPGGEPSSRLTIDDEQDVPVDLPSIHRATLAALEALGVPDDAGLAVTLVDPERMAELKEHALGERAPTDVLAFPMDDVSDPMPGPLIIGDVVLCPAVAATQARDAGHSFDDELRLLLVHGILHCLGRDHATPAEEAAMFAEQAQLLASIGHERAER